MMDNELHIIPTADGSNTIYNSQVGENYHSRNGALQESRHVFLDSGLKYFLERHPGRNTVSILEVGFGTGLNFLLTADFCAKQDIDLNYTGIEAYPLPNEMISQTGYNQYISAGLWQQFIAGYTDALNAPINLPNKARLQIASCPLLQYQSEQQYDVIYFDAFAVAHQPEMWDDTTIGHTIAFLKPGGIFVTYAITGNLKRAIKALGCKVEKAPGAAGKREMLRAIKNGSLILS